MIGSPVGFATHQRRDRSGHVAHGDHRVIGAEAEIERLVDHHLVTAGNDGLDLHAGTLGDRHEARTVGVVDIRERHGTVHQDVDGRRVRRGVQRTEARRGRAFQEFRAGHFGLVEDVVAVRVETALEYETAARTVRIAVGEHSGRNQRVEAVDARCAVPAIIALAAREKDRGRQERRGQQ